MKLLILSPFHGGSHRAWAEGYQKHSAHEVRLLTLPARFWKWRMHGGAITLARLFLEWDWMPDAVLATDMLDLTTFVSLTRRRLAGIPFTLYMHENQLTYPLAAEPGQGPMRRQHGERDLHYVFINVASALLADRVFFNSRHHLEAFLAALPRYLGRFPEYRESQLVDSIAAKSQVLHVGVDFARLDPEIPLDASAPPLVLWNQRWEYDKNPAAFFAVLDALRQQKVDFQVAICGQNYRRHPKEFDRARQTLGARIVHFGFASENKYRQLLWQAHATFSTTSHEFFGISMLEAAYCRTALLLPPRLSYPELFPREEHAPLFYQDSNELLEKLTRILRQPALRHQQATVAAKYVARFDWSHMAPRYDALLMTDA